METINRKEAKEKGLTHYYTGKPCKHGHIAKRRVVRGDCTECIKGSEKKHYWEDPDRSRKTSRDAWVRLGRKNCKVKAAEYKKTFPEKNREHLKKRSNAEKRQTPHWLKEIDAKLIKFFYKKAQALTAFTGIKFEVDHEIPLQGDLASGFHSPDNLRVIPACVNLAKSNKFNIEEYNAIHHGS